MNVVSRTLPNPAGFQPVLALALVVFSPLLAFSADHGPVFGLGTPTNPKGGWSFNTGLSHRNGSGGSILSVQTQLSYGLTENLKFALSAPLGSKADCSVCLNSGGDPYPRSAISLNTPISRDFSGIAWWRFHRKDFAGKRVESTLMGGLLVPGAQLEPGVYRNLHSGPGYLIGAVTGVAGRSQYFWAGGNYQRYAESKNDRRPDLLSYSAVYGYRPFSWRTDYPRWDWRVFGEFTGEKTGSLKRLGTILPGSEAHNMFFGPSVLGVYKNIGIEGGIQFPLYRHEGVVYAKERYRVALNFACFF